MGLRVCHQDIGAVGFLAGRSLSRTTGERKKEDSEESQQRFLSQTTDARESPQPLVPTCRIYVKPFEFAHCIAPPIVYDICLPEYKYSTGSCGRVTLGSAGERSTIGADRSEGNTFCEAATLLKKDVNK